MAEAITCVNCGSPVSTPYCGACGQKNPPKKLNFLTLYTDFQSRVFGFDGLFPRTLRDLTVAPGNVAKIFVQGNRVRYVGPVGYFFFTLTLFLLLTQFLEVDVYEFSNESSPFVENQSAEQQQLSEEFSKVVIEHMRLFSFLQIPITAALAWLFFRKSGYNFLEHSVYAFYIAGHVMWLSMIAIVIYAVYGFSANTIQLIVYWMIFAYGCTTFYQGSKIKSAIKGLLVQCLSFVLFGIFAGIAGVIYVLTNPALLEKLKNAPR